jgi:hypothetical protein
MSPSWVRRSDVPVVIRGCARRYNPEQVMLFASQLRTHRMIPVTFRESA